MEHKNILVSMLLSLLCGYASADTLSKNSYGGSRITTVQHSNADTECKNFNQDEIDPSLFQLCGHGSVSPKTMINYLLVKNRACPKDRAEQVVNAYIQESEEEGVNYDVAFIQMCHETNYLKFGGDAQSKQNNFCGLGVTGHREHGLSFPSLVAGIKAHVQHLKLYGSEEPLRNKCIDPRSKLVVPRGKSPTVDGLSGTWAADPKYHIKLRNKLIELKQLDAKKNRKNRHR